MEYPEVNLGGASGFGGGNGVTGYSITVVQAGTNYGQITGQIAADGIGLRVTYNPITYDFSVAVGFAGTGTPFPGSYLSYFAGVGFAHHAAGRVQCKCPGT